MNIQTGDITSGAKLFGGFVSTKTGPLNVAKSVTVNYPLTMEFEIVKANTAQCNTGHFRIYNLGDESRNQIFHDYNDIATYRQIILNAGYSSDLSIPIIFQGNIIKASSYRQGTNWITEIEALDGGYSIQNSQSISSMSSQIDGKGFFLNLIKDMKHVTSGAVGDFPSQPTRGQSVMKSTWEAITDILGDAEAFIDNERVNIINKDEYIDRGAKTFDIDDSVGLLGTPRLGQAVIDIDILFEPRLTLADPANVLLTSVAKVYNDLWKVNGVKHRGVISGAVGGEVVTTLTLYRGGTVLKAVKMAS
jgi:hypothetical protein